MRPDERAGLFELPLTADQRCRLDRQVRLIQRPQRREVCVAELVKTLGQAKVLEAVITEVAQPYG